MTAYQDELKRSLPKLGCEGVFDYEYDTLSIQYNGYVLGFQNSNGNLNYSRDLLNTDCNKKLDEVIEKLKNIREYVTKYLHAPELPFDGVKEYRLIAEYGDTVLAATRTGNQGFMFCTWTQNKKHNFVTHGDYSQNYEYAKESFVKRSGLLNEHKIFTQDEAKDLYKSVSYAMENCETLTYKDEQNLKSLLEKLTWGYPELEENPPSFSDGYQETANMRPNMI